MTTSMSTAQKGSQAGKLDGVPGPEARGARPNRSFFPSSSPCTSEVVCAKADQKRLTTQPIQTATKLIYSRTRSRGWIYTLVESAVALIRIHQDRVGRLGSTGSHDALVRVVEVLQDRENRACRRVVELLGQSVDVCNGRVDSVALVSDCRPVLARHPCWIRQTRP